MQTFWQDLRFGLRMLLKNPAVSAIAILSLALGIGASTTIFSVVDAILLRALPYPNPQEIVRVWEQAPNGRRMNFADPNFEDFRTQNNTFASLAEYAYESSSVSGGSEPVRVDVAEASKDFFPSLGVEPFRGRAFAPEEQRPHGAPAVIISYSYWQRYLGGASASPLASPPRLRSPASSQLFSSASAPPTRSLSPLSPWVSPPLPSSPPTFPPAAPCASTPTSPCATNSRFVTSDALNSIPPSQDRRRTALRLCSGIGIGADGRKSVPA